MPKEARILVIRFSAMGDVAMCLPVLKAFQNKHPNQRLSILTKEAFVPLFKDLSNVEFIRLKKGEGIFSLLQRILKLEPFDLVMDLHSSLRSTLICSALALKGAKTHKIDKRRAEKKKFLNTENILLKPITSQAQAYLDVLEHFGFKLSMNDLKPIKSAKKNSNQMRIGVAPFAAHSSKTYPEDLMQTLIEKICDFNSDIEILLFGAPGIQQERLKAWCKNSTQLKTNAGMSLEKELALMTQLDLMISMDSANGHMAANFGVPVITLWGSTHPYAGYQPLFQPFKNSFLPDYERYPELPSSIFGEREIGGYEDAMRSINQESLHLRIKEILNL